MSGPTARAAALPRSGSPLRPPISKAQARQAFDQENGFPDALWLRIEILYERFGHVKDMLAAPRDNINPRDQRSFGKGRERAIRRLEKAQGLVAKQLEEIEFNAALTENAFIARRHHSERGIEEYLRIASRVLTAASDLARDAQSIDFALPSEATARRYLARLIFEAVRDAGLETDLTGWRDSRPGGLAEADMTRVERLISALGVQDSATPKTFVRWLRKAIGVNCSMCEEWFAP